VRKYPILLVLLAILIAQPLVTGSIGNLAAGSSIPDSEGVYSPAVGFRLDPGDLTDHVPIIIDEEADFVSQGWPGTGTSGDPYVIAGLNITSSIGSSGIQIIDTTSYFVIRDCYINHNTGIQAIWLGNATHGTVEHNTIISDSGGIYVIDSNSTTISHNEISNYGSGMYEFSINVHFSWDCVVERNLCYTDDNMGSLYLVCPNLILNYNSWENGNPSRPNVIIDSSNDTVANHNRILGGNVGLTLQSSHNVQIDNLTVFSDGAGLEIDTCPWFELTNSHIETPGVGLEMGASPNTTIADSYFRSISAPNIGIFVSDDLTMSGNTIEDGVSSGIYLDTCHDSVLVDNTLLNCGSDSFILDGCDDAYVSGNVIDSPCDYGIVVAGSQRAVLESNEINTHFGDYGIYVVGSFDGIATGNIINATQFGIYFDNVGNWTFTDNTVDYAEIGYYGDTTILMYGRNNYATRMMAGILFEDVDTAEFTGNDFYELEVGIVLVMAAHVNVYDNTVDFCEYGIYVEMFFNLTCSSNTITNFDDNGIEIAGGNVGQVIGNTITPEDEDPDPEVGIYFESCYGFNVTDNVLTDCGIVFDTGEVLDAYNHTFSNNLVNGQSIYYSVSEESATINPVSYGQIILVNCTDIDITGKTWGSATIPIQLYYCDYINIPDVTTTSNMYGIQASSSDNVTITDITSSGDESTAIYLDTCADFYIEGLIQNGGDYGAYIYNSDYGTLYLCTIDQSSNGIYAPSTNELDIMNCDITNIDNNGIYGTGDYVKVLDCYISNTVYGVRVDGGDFWNITNNLIEYCTHGISLISSAQNGIAHNNEIYSSVHHGIILNTGCNNWEITNNTILWSGMWGIHAYQATGLDVYYNTIGLSGTGNADDTNSNTWDDTVDTGNWWSDYSGPGTYPLPGGGGSVDNYPMSFLPDTPLIQYPIDISYAEGSTGNTASWIVFDNYLSHYRVTIDGVIVLEDAFVDVNEDTATVDIDGLAYGDHSVIITVWDIEDNTATDTIVVHVFDDTDPTINGPPNMEIFVGGSGQEITWEVSDLHPNTYTVELDGEEYATGSWTNGELSINIDGLTAGEHVLVLYIYDVDGNEISDGVAVLVIDDSVAPAVDSPDDLVIILGTTGNSIIWTPTDAYPASYAVSSNGSVYASGDWGGSRIIVVVDGLPLGNHTFTLTVQDGSGSSATDTVTVTVLPFEGWTPEPAPLDYTMVLVVVGAFAGVIVLAVVVYFVKLKKS